MPSDLDLLAIEMETLWRRDARGRLFQDGAGGPHLVVAVASEGRLAGLGCDVPDELGRELIGAAENGPSLPPGQPPSGIDAWAESLAAVLGPVEVRSGPSYVAERAPRATSGARLLVSDGSAPSAEGLRPPPEAGWEDEEWRSLLGGELGPWAMALVGDQVASICFSSRLTERAAEAGLRTEPAYRRAGHGAAVTAAWASLVIASGRIAFYSTSADNMASQAVAARLRLRPIGWIWQIRAAGD